MEQAIQELGELRQVAKDSRVQKLTIFDLNAIPVILTIAQGVLAGEIVAVKGDYDRAITYLERAIALEDGLNYTEPKDWYLPPRQVLGAIFLQSGKPAEAERVYREDLRAHPQNGWSLFGLVQSLEAQGKVDEVKDVKREFLKSWADADVTLTSSRF